jgi:hypothetical protein
MSFHHPSVNEFFGFDEMHVIPFICIDNPLVYVLKAQESMKKPGSNTTWIASELKSLL